MPKIKRARPLFKFKRRLAYIDVDMIVPNVSNPREPITRKEVTDILESIKTMRGVLVPIVVYREGEDFVLLDGERRWRACKKLSRQDSYYKLIPANIIEKPLTPLQNLQTMFNIHQRRKEWSTAAKAEAIAKLLKLKGDLSVGKLVELTGLDETTVGDALLLQKFNMKVRMRCLSGYLDEFYPILLARNLRSLQRTFPSLFKKYSWRHLADTFLQKVDKGYIRRTKDFNKLGQMAKSCIEYRSEQLFLSMFQKMVEEERFTPADAQKEVRRELGYKLEEAFKNTCAEFRRSLKSYLKGKSDVDEIPKATREHLTEIYQILKECILQKRID